MSRFLKFKMLFKKKLFMPLYTNDESLIQLNKDRKKKKESDEPN